MTLSVTEARVCEGQTTSTITVSPTLASVYAGISLCWHQSIICQPSMSMSMCVTHVSISLSIITATLVSIITANMHMYQSFGLHMYQ